ncbi:MAG TPA: phytanoyl-CoA dioxygenase family protein, partial [Cyanophyceae cyanobacterium]
DGFALGINLAQSIRQEIYEFALTMPCYGNGNPNLEFYYSEKDQIQAKHGSPIFRGNYLNSDFLCPAIKQLGNNPTLLEIATKYLETDSVRHEHQLWWNFPVESTIYERRRNAQMFHYEPYNRRSLKFLFYLTDVDLCSSPHVCVRGSHIKKKLAHRLFYGGRSHPEIVNYYGYKNIVPICGKAGFGFVEDTACFHKATPPGSKDRLILELTYSK